MRKNRLRKHLNYQLVAILLSTIFILLFTPLINAQEIKAPIAAALDKGDTTLAINLLNDEIEIDKAYYLNYFMLGKIYYERENYKEAARQFQLALDAKKKHYDSLYLLGMSQLKLGNIDEAMAAFKQGKKKDKKHLSRFEDGMGLVLMEQKKFQEADKSFRQALVDEPNNPTYHIHLGDANFYQGVPSLAILEYEKALEVDTAGLEVYYHWAEACLEMKDYTCAIEKLKIVLQKDSTHAPSWRRAAGIYYKAARSSRSRQERKTRFIETIGAYKKYLELSGAKADSAHVRVYFELAMSYSAIYGYEDAVDYYEKVINIPYVVKDIYFNYGKALWGVKQYEKSGEYLLKHIEWVKEQNADYKSSIKDYELYQLLGDSYYYRSSKDYMTAINYYLKSLADRPDQKRLLQNVAVGYHSLKSYAQAIEYYQKRIDLGITEKSASLLKNAGYCALNIANGSSGDNEEEDLEEDGVEEVGASDPDVNYYETAVNYMLQYIAYKPDDKKILSVIANTYLYQLADCANGVKYFDKIVAMDPSDCDAKKSLGYAYFGGLCTKNYSKALKYLNKAYKCIAADKGDCADVSLILWIAQCYHLQGAAKAEKAKDATVEYGKAYKWYGKVLKCEPGNADAQKGQADLEFER